jgi:hypothetical protein
VLGYNTPAGQRFAESRKHVGFVRRELTGMLARWHGRKARSANPEGHR